MSLIQILNILRKRWVAAAGTLVLVLGIGLLATALSSTKYTATTSVFISTQSSGPSSLQQLYEGGTFSTDRVKSYADIATSPRVLDAVVRDLGLPYDAARLSTVVEAEAPVETVLVNISASTEDPVSAAAISNSAARNLASTIGELEAPAPGQASPVRATIVAAASPPESPTWPSWTPVVVGLIVLAILAAVGVSVLIERLDRSVKTAEELAELTSRPTLVSLPRDNAIARNGARAENSVAMEPVRKLRAGLQFSNVDGQMRSVLVTSALPGEGKSSVSLRLAEAFARVGARTCLLEADLRRPTLADAVGVPNDVGLTNILIGQVSVDQAMHRIAGGLNVITSGPTPPNPNELLSSQTCQRIVDELRSRFEFLIVDSPPTLPVADASVLSRMTDAAVLVVSAETTTKVQVLNALEAITGQDGSHVVGCVLNLVKSASDGYSSYGYSYQSIDPETKRRPEMPAFSGADPATDVTAASGPGQLSQAGSRPSPARRRQ